MQRSVTLDVLILSFINDLLKHYHYIKRTTYNLHSTYIISIVIRYSNPGFN